MKAYVLGKEKFLDKEGKTGGDAYGYFIGTNIVARALQGVGVEITPDADLYIHYVPPHSFSPVEGKVNILYTMWEYDRLSDEFVGILNQADCVLAASDWLRSVYKNSGVFKTVYTCRQGCDTEFYEYKLREWRDYQERGKPFRFLWLGALNQRKGWDLAIRGFHQAFFGTKRRAEFYIKTSKFGGEGEITQMGRYSTIIDSRNVSFEELRNIYYSAYAFLFPSRGEGLGMPPLEAMATGVPVIAPQYSTMREYVLKEHAYPVPFRKQTISVGVMTECAEVVVDELAETLRYVYDHPKEVMRKGLKASIFVGEQFSLRGMGERLLWVFEKIKKKEILK